MKRPFLILGFVGFLITNSLALEFTIESPDKGEVWPKSSMVNRVLHWSEKKQVLTAEVTFSTALYSGNGDPTQTETYEFQFPGVSYDDQQKQFFVTAPNGEKVAIGLLTKVFLGKRIDLFKVARIRVTRIKTELTLALEVNTAPVEDQPTDADGVRKVPLSSVISQ